MRDSWVCNRCRTRGCEWCGQEWFEKRLKKENEMLLWNDDVVARVQRSHNRWIVGVMVFVLVLWLIAGLYVATR